MVRTTVVLLCLLGSAIGQHLRWVYQLDRPGWPNAIAYGADGGIVAAGYSVNDTGFCEFTVASVTATGTERWVYRHGEPGAFGYTEARAVVRDTSGNIYAAGVAPDSTGNLDFTVLSLTPDGNKRWAYRHNGPGDGGDAAYAVVIGEDGNIYAAGTSSGDYPDCAFAVISLTPGGAERWVYRHDGTLNYTDMAYSVTYGNDGNVYAAGFVDGPYHGEKIAVVSLTPGGGERWVYTYDGPGGWYDIGYSVACGTDGNVYVAAEVSVTFSSTDFAVVSLTPETGGERWLYLYNGPGNGPDYPRCVKCGLDGNIYAAGSSWGDGTGDDFTVLSLTPACSLRWIYRYNGSADAYDGAYSLDCGTDGTVYGAGASGEGTASHFTVARLAADSGQQRWVYRHVPPGSTWGRALSVVHGEDGNVYAGGHVVDNNTYRFVVLSLDTTPAALEERSSRSASPRMSLAAGGVQAGRLDYSLTLDHAARVSLSLRDLSGRKVRSWQVNARAGVSHHRAELPNVSTGIYFASAEAWVGGRREKVSRKLALLE